MSLRASFFLFFDDFFVKLSIITIVSGDVNGLGGG